MHVIGAFKYSTYIELAAMDLEHSGIPQADILVVPFEWEDPAIPNAVLTHKGDPSGFNLIFICGAVLMILGSIYGFVLAPGPIFCAIIGLLAGGAIGYGIDVLLLKKQKRTLPGLTEVIMIVNVPDESAARVEQVLRQNQAFGVAKVQ